MNSQDTQQLRHQLLSLLKGGNAHVNFDSAVKGLAPELRGIRPPSAEHSVWELVEHMRIAQWDILEYVRNPAHVSPDFPDGYWPASPAPQSANIWNRSLAGFRSDTDSLAEIVSDRSVDLLKPVPQMEGQPILQKILLTADHNAYHLGQIILVRRLLGAWK